MVLAAIPFVELKLTNIVPRQKMVAKHYFCSNDALQLTLT